MNNIEMQRVKRPLLPFLDPAIRSDLLSVIRCLDVKVQIYEKGGLQIKSAVERVFAYSLSRLNYTCNKVEWNVIKAKMPMTLSGLLKKQL